MAQKAICKFLSAKFGDISRDLQGRVKRIGDIEALDKILDEIFSADSLSDAIHVVESAS